MGAPSSHKLRIAIRAAMHDLGAAPPGRLFEFLKPDRIEQVARELAGGDADRRVSATWVRKLASRHGSFDKAGFGRRMFEQAVDEMEAVIRDNAAGYVQAVRAVSQGAGREALGPALLADLSDYVDLDTREAEARQRIYHLALAAADDGPGRAFRDLLRERYIRLQAAYWTEMFHSYMGAYSRRLIEGVPPEQLQRAIAAIFEGYIVHRRSGIEIPDEEIVDAMLRLFAAHSRRPDEPGLDPDVELFGRPRLSREGRRITGDILAGGPAMTEIIEAIEQADSEGGEVVRFAALFIATGTSTSPRSELGARLTGSMFAHARDGGELRVLVSLDTPAQLDRMLETQGDMLDEEFKGTLETRTLIDTPPLLSPVVVGERSAFMLREDEGAGTVTQGARLVDGASIGLLTSSFDEMWRSAKATTLVHESDPYPKGIVEARRRLERLA